MGLLQYLRRGSFKKNTKKTPLTFATFTNPVTPGRHGLGPAQAVGVSSLGEAASEREQAGERASFAKGCSVAWNFDFPPWLGPLQRPSLSENTAPVLNRSMHSPCGTVQTGSGADNRGKYLDSITVIHPAAASLSPPRTLAEVAG